MKINSVLNKAVFLRVMESCWLAVCGNDCNNAPDRSGDAGGGLVRAGGMYGLLVRPGHGQRHWH